MAEQYKQLLKATNVAKSEMNDILEDETHLPSKYIAIGLKQGVMAVALAVKRNQLDDLAIDVVKRYQKARSVMFQLHPMQDEQSISSFDDGFQLASRALIDVITNDEQLNDKVKLDILRSMDEQLTTLGKVEHS